eukprot:11133399-Karenia_brevis.AAC.1
MSSWEGWQDFDRVEPDEPEFLSCSEDGYEGPFRQAGASTRQASAVRDQLLAKEIAAEWQGLGLDADEHEILQELRAKQTAEE